MRPSTCAGCCASAAWPWPRCSGIRWAREPAYEPSSDLDHGQQRSVSADPDHGAFAIGAERFYFGQGDY
jgi:hypothetical protein